MACNMFWFQERFTFLKLNKTMSTTQVTNKSKVKIDEGEPDVSTYIFAISSLKQIIMLCVSTCHDF